MPCMHWHAGVAMQYLHAQTGDSAIRYAMLKAVKIETFVSTIKENHKHREGDVQWSKSSMGETN